MKRLLILGALISSLSAHAYLREEELSCTDIDDGSSDFVDAFGDLLFCSVSTTISLPTVVVEGQELNLNTVEADFRLLAEANEDVEAELSTMIAETFGVSLDEVFFVVKKLDEMNKLTVANVAQSLK